VLHKVLSSDTSVLSSRVAVTDSSMVMSALHPVLYDSSMVASERCQSALHPVLYDDSCCCCCCGKRGFVVESGSVVCAKEELVFTDDNNNADKVINDDRLRALTVDDRDNVTSLTEASAVDFEAFPSHSLALDPPDDEETAADTVVDDLSDMSIDVDNEDLDGDGLIQYVAAEVEASSAPARSDRQPSCNISVLQTDVAATELNSGLSVLH